MKITKVPNIWSNYFNNSCNDAIKRKEDVTDEDGRDWTEEEREEYYKNFGNNWPKYLEKFQKILFKIYGIDYSEEINKQDNQYLKNYVYESYSKKIDVEETVKNFSEKINNNSILRKKTNEKKRKIDRFKW